MDDNKPKTIEDICEGLQSRDERESFLALHVLATNRPPQSYSFEDEPLLWRTNAFEARRLKLLVTENTRIRKQPFIIFADQLGGLLKKSLDSKSFRVSKAREVEEIFAEYRRNLENFFPLETSTRLVHGAWGNLLCCYADPDTSFFATASGETHNTLIHFDQWFRSDTRSPYGDELIAAFSRRLSELLDNNPHWAVALIEKEYGPAGPASVWSEIAQRLHTLPRICRFNQRTHTLTAEPTNGHSPTGYVSLYDLIKTGDGIREIDERLRSRPGKPQVHHIVLYDYGQKDIAVDRNTVTTFFNQHDDLSPSQLATLISSAKPITESGSHNVFSNIRLNDVDQVAKYKLTKTDDFGWVRASMPNLEKQYAGKWIAVKNRRVLDVNQDVAALRERIARRYPDAIYCHILNG